MEKRQYIKEYYDRVRVLKNDQTHKLNNYITVV